MSTDEITKSNIPEFSVSELSHALKRTIEDSYAHVRVRGELSRVSIAASGHMYSGLKDEKTVIDAICWKGTMSKLSIKPEEGLEVVCTGRLTTYPARSNYQLIIETMELAGQGALLKMLEERRKKLTAEGLFAEERKKPLPLLPNVIGVVTSPTGAVIRDILHRLADRFPRHVLLWPVMVQGKGAAEQVAAAVRGFETITQHGLPKPDLLIVGRGGGSLEDLMPFNEECVVRAIAESTIPVISAVGHETDTTLADYAADYRAPTPTGAAEKAVPVRMELLAYLTEQDMRLTNAAQRNLSEKKQHIQTLSARLGTPDHLIETQSQSLDRLSDRLNHSFSHFISHKKQALVEHSARLRAPNHLVQDKTNQLNRWSEQLETARTKMLQPAQEHLTYLGKMLEAYSIENVLNRGFAAVMDDKGNVVTTPDNLKNGDEITLRFAQQKTVNAHVSGSKDPAAKPKKAKVTPKPTEQQSLF